MRVNGPIIALVSLSAFGGCSKPEPAAPPPTPAPAAESQGAEAEAAEPDDETLRGHMSASFQLALEARDAVVDGDLATAQQKAKDLAWQDYKTVLPERWMPGVDKMQLAARKLAESSSLEEAAGHVASVAAACGECHSRFESDADDAERNHGFSAKGSEDIQVRMARHQRAVDGFWFGLTIPSEASWRGGARTLTETPEEPVTVEGQEANPELEAALDTLREFGTRALKSESVDERVKVYGELLAKCSSCHKS